MLAPTQFFQIFVSMGNFQGLVSADHFVCKNWEVVCLAFVDRVFNDFSIQGLSG
jgi:hypothetical protein